MPLLRRSRGELAPRKPLTIDVDPPPKLSDRNIARSRAPASAPAEPSADRPSLSEHSSDGEVFRTPMTATFAFRDSDTDTAGSAGSAGSGLGRWSVSSLSGDSAHDHERDRQRQRDHGFPACPAQPSPTTSLPTPTSATAPRHRAPEDTVTAERMPRRRETGDLPSDPSTPTPIQLTHISSYQGKDGYGGDFHSHGDGEYFINPSSSTAVSAAPPPFPPTFFLSAEPGTTSTLEAPAEYRERNSRSASSSPPLASFASPRPLSSIAALPSPVQFEFESHSPPASPQPRPQQGRAAVPAWQRYSSASDIARERSKDDLADAFQHDLDGPTTTDGSKELSDTSALSSGRTSIDRSRGPPSPLGLGLFSSPSPSGSSVFPVVPVMEEERLIPSDSHWSGSRPRTPMFETPVIPPRSASFSKSKDNSESLRIADTASATGREQEPAESVTPAGNAKGKERETDYASAPSLLQSSTTSSPSSPPSSLDNQPPSGHTLSHGSLISPALRSSPSLAANDANDGPGLPSHSPGLGAAPPPLNRSPSVRSARSDWSQQQQQQQQQQQRQRAASASAKNGSPSGGSAVARLRSFWGEKSSTTKPPVPPLPRSSSSGGATEDSSAAAMAREKEDSLTTTVAARIPSSDSGRVLADEEATVEPIPDVPGGVDGQKATPPGIEKDHLEARAGDEKVDSVRSADALTGTTNMADPSSVLPKVDVDEARGTTTPTGETEHARAIVSEPAAAPGEKLGEARSPRRPAERALDVDAKITGPGADSHNIADVPGVPALQTLSTYPPSEPVEELVDPTPAGPSSTSGASTGPHDELNAGSQSAMPSSSLARQSVDSAISGMSVLTLGSTPVPCSPAAASTPEELEGESSMTEWAFPLPPSQEIEASTDGDLGDTSGARSASTFGPRHPPPPFATPPTAEAALPDSTILGRDEETRTADADGEPDLASNEAVVREALSSERDGGGFEDDEQDDLTREWADHRAEALQRLQNVVQQGVGGLGIGIESNEDGLRAAREQTKDGVEVFRTSQAQAGSEAVVAAPRETGGRRTPPIEDRRSSESRRPFATPRMGQEGSAAEALPPPPPLPNVNAQQSHDASQELVTGQSQRHTSNGLDDHVALTPTTQSSAAHFFAVGRSLSPPPGKRQGQPLSLESRSSSSVTSPLASPRSTPDLRRSAIAVDSPTLPQGGPGRDGLASGPTRSIESPEAAISEALHSDARLTRHRRSAEHSRNEAVGEEGQRPSLGQERTPTVPASKWSEGGEFSSHRISLYAAPSLPDLAPRRSGERGKRAPHPPVAGSITRQLSQPETPDRASQRKHRTSLLGATGDVFLSLGFGKSRKNSAPESSLTVTGVVGPSSAVGASKSSETDSLMNKRGRPRAPTLGDGRPTSSVSQHSSEASGSRKRMSVASSGTASLSSPGYGSGAPSIWSLGSRDSRTGGDQRGFVYRPEETDRRSEVSAGDHAGRESVSGRSSASLARRMRPSSIVVSRAASYAASDTSSLHPPSRPDPPEPISPVNASEVPRFPTSRAELDDIKVVAAMVTKFHPTGGLFSSRGRNWKSRYMVLTSTNKSIGSPSTTASPGPPPSPVAPRATGPLTRAHLHIFKSNNAMHPELERIEITADSYIAIADGLDEAEGRRWVLKIGGIWRGDDGKAKGGKRAGQHAQWLIQTKDRDSMVMWQDEVKSVVLAKRAEQMGLPSFRSHNGMQGDMDVELSLQGLKASNNSMERPRAASTSSSFVQVDHPGRIAEETKLEQRNLPSTSSVKSGSWGVLSKGRHRASASISSLASIGSRSSNNDTSGSQGDGPRRRGSKASLQRTSSWALPETRKAVRSPSQAALAALSAAMEGHEGITPMTDETGREGLQTRSGPDGSNDSSESRPIDDLEQDPLPPPLDTSHRKRTSLSPPPRPKARPIPSGVPAVSDADLIVGRKSTSSVSTATPPLGATPKLEATRPGATAASLTGAPTPGPTGRLRSRSQSAMSLPKVERGSVGSSHFDLPLSPSRVSLQRHQITPPSAPTPTGALPPIPVGPAQLPKRPSRDSVLGLAPMLLPSLLEARRQGQTTPPSSTSPTLPSHPSRTSNNMTHPFAPAPSPTSESFGPSLSYNRPGSTFRRSVRPSDISVPPLTRRSESNSSLRSMELRSPISPPPTGSGIVGPMTGSSRVGTPTMARTSSEVTSRTNMTPTSMVASPTYPPPSRPSLHRGNTLLNRSGQQPPAMRPPPRGPLPSLPPPGPPPSAPLPALPASPPPSGPLPPPPRPPTPASASGPLSPRGSVSGNKPALPPPLPPPQGALPPLPTGAMQR